MVWDERSWRWRGPPEARCHNAVHTRCGAPLLPPCPPLAAAAPGEAYEFNAAAFANRALKNKALVGGVGVGGCVCVGGWGSRGGWGQA